MHSHDDYDGGKCHDASQVHRGGSTDKVGPIGEGQPSDVSSIFANKPKLSWASNPRATRIEQLISERMGPDGYVQGYMKSKDDFMVLYKAGVIKKDEKKNRWYFVPEAARYKEWENDLNEAHKREKAPKETITAPPSKPVEDPDKVRSQPKKEEAKPPETKEEKEEAKPPETKEDDAKIDIERNWELGGLWVVNGLANIEYLEKLRLGRWVGSNYILDKNTAERLAKDSSYANAQKIADERQKLIESKQANLSKKSKVRAGPERE